MPQRLSPWRVNDAVLYNVLRDDVRAVVAGFLFSEQGEGARVANLIAQARSELHDLNGFDRDEVVTKLTSFTRPSPLVTEPPVASTDREELVLQSVFHGAQPGPHPTLVLLAGAPGAGTGRSIGPVRRMHGNSLVPIEAEDLQAFHPRYLEPAFRASPAGQHELSRSAASWLQAVVTHARERHFSLLLEGAFGSPSTALAVARRFTDADFQVHVVIAATRSEESLLSATSRGLRQMQQRLPSQFVPPPEHARSLADVDALVEASVADSTVGRVSVIGRRGQVVLDAHRADPAAMADVSAAFRALCTERMSALEGAQWLSELRHMTAFAQSLRSIPGAAVESLVALHEIAIQRVVPELPVPPNSEVVRIQQERLTADLAALRRVHKVAEVPDTAAPITTPSAPGTSISR